MVSVATEKMPTRHESKDGSTWSTREDAVRNDGGIDLTKAYGEDGDYGCRGIMTTVVHSISRDGSAEDMATLSWLMERLAGHRADEATLKAAERENPPGEGERRVYTTASGERCYSVESAISAEIRTEIENAMPQLSELLRCRLGGGHRYCLYPEDEKKIAFRSRYRAKQAFSSLSEETCLKLKEAFAAFAENLSTFPAPATGRWSWR